MKHKSTTDSLTACCDESSLIDKPPCDWKMSATDRGRLDESRSTKTKKTSYLLLPTSSTYRSITVTVAFYTLSPHSLSFCRQANTLPLLWKL